MFRNRHKNGPEVFFQGRFLSFHGKRQVHVSGIEHHQIDRHCPPVLTIVERIHQFDDTAALRKSLRQTVFRNNGKFALQHDSGIDYGMTVHRQPLTGSDRNPKNRNTGCPRRIRRQCRAVPTLGSIDDRRGTGPYLAGVRRHNSARCPGRIAAQLPQRIPGHYFRFFLRITSSISSVIRDRSHSGFQPHSSRAQVSSSELGQLSAMAFFTGSTS